MSKLVLVPLDDTVVFPNVTLTLAVDAGDDDRVFLVPRKGSDFAGVGVVAEVVERLRLPGGAPAVSVRALHRGIAGSTLTVYPAASLAPMAHSYGARLVIANLQPTGYDDIAHAVLTGPLSEVLPAITS